MVLALAKPVMLAWAGDCDIFSVIWRRKKLSIRKVYFLVWDVFIHLILLFLGALLNYLFARCLLVRRRTQRLERSFAVTEPSLWPEQSGLVSAAPKLAVPSTPSFVDTVPHAVVQMQGISQKHLAHTKPAVCGWVAFILHAATPLHSHVYMCVCTYMYTCRCTDACSTTDTHI